MRARDQVQHRAEALHGPEGGLAAGPRCSACAAPPGARSLGSSAWRSVPRRLTSAPLHAAAAPPHRRTAAPAPLCLSAPLGQIDFLVRRRHVCLIPVLVFLSSSEAECCGVTKASEIALVVKSRLNHARRQRIAKINHSKAHQVRTSRTPVSIVGCSCARDMVCNTETCSCLRFQQCPEFSDVGCCSNIRFQWSEVDH